MPKNRESLEGEIDKALNKDQSEQDLFQSAIGCTMDSAFEDMCQIKRYGIRKKVCRDSIWCRVLLPGEISPELGASNRNGICGSAVRRKNFRRWSVPSQHQMHPQPYCVELCFHGKREKSTAAMKKTYVTGCGRFRTNCA